MPILLNFIKWIGYFLLFLLSLHTFVRVVRKFYKFPVPHYLVPFIDNRLRRNFYQPLEDTPIRHGVQPGMQVLEIGPGRGSYSIATAKRLGPEGKLTTIDIEPQIIGNLKARLEKENISNIEARVEDVYALPFEDQHFDLIYMITVIGEIPDPARAIGELHRVLKHEGTLVFSELLPDPDYPLCRTLTRWAGQGGFKLKKKIGGFFYYTAIFEPV